MMYKLAVKQDFIAQHFLVGGDWGTENQKHSHHYQIEVKLAARELDQHGYLVDIVNVRDSLERLVTHFKDKTLNDLPEFSVLNPSIEHLARICYEMLSGYIDREDERLRSVKIWEDDLAWTSFSKE